MDTQVPSTPERNIVLEPINVPIPEYKLGNKSKYKYPGSSIESPCKFHGDFVELDQIFKRPSLSNGTYLKRGTSKENGSDQLSGRVESDYCENQSLSSVSSSISETGSTPPSSSPVLDKSFLEKDLDVGMGKARYESIIYPVFPLTAHVKKTFKPKKNLRPFKSILKKSEGLNYIMTSLSGDFRDATIFATEVNSYPTDKILYPRNSMERVTIPVNPEIKSKYKFERNKIMDGYHDDDTDDDDYIHNVDDSNSNNNKSNKNNNTENDSFDNYHLGNDNKKIETSRDAAIIRAYPFEYKNDDEFSTGLEIVQQDGIYSVKGVIGTQSLRDYDKKVMWCQFLER